MEFEIINKRGLYEKIYGSDYEDLIDKAIVAEDIEEDEIDLDEEGRFIWLDSQQLGGGGCGLNMDDLKKFTAALLKAQELNPHAVISIEEVDTAGSYTNLEIFIDIDNINPYLFTVGMGWEDDEE